MATWTQVASRSVKSVQVTTESAPSSAAEGMSLDNVAGYHLYAEADSGQTFTGTGSFPGFMYDEICGWSRATERDVSIVAQDASNRRVYLGSFPNDAPRGRIAHVASGVGVTAGGVTLYYAASSLYGERI